MFCFRAKNVMTLGCFQIQYHLTICDLQSAAASALELGTELSLDFFPSLSPFIDVLAEELVF